MTVDLIDHRNRRQASFQRLAQDESRLWQATLGRINQQHHAIDHLQDAFDLSTKVSVAGRVHDIDFHIAIMDGRVLRHDRNATLALKIHRIHDALTHLFVLAKGPGLAQHRVNQRGLAVIDVSNNCDIPNVSSWFSHKHKPRSATAIFHRLRANFQF